MPQPFHQKPSHQTDWRDLEAPDLDAFARMAREAFDALPAPFRKHADDTVIRVEEFPDEEIAHDMGLESPFDLLGLYQGVSLTERGADGAEPAMVFLYRRPILDIWAEGGESLGGLIRHVLTHEIGHHFGLSDDDMEALEAAAEREEG